MTDEEMEKLFEGAKRHYIHACEKHPKFCDTVTFSNDAENHKGNVEYIKAVNKSNEAKGRLNAKGLLNEEYEEMLAEYAAGNRGRLIEELLDCIAVLMRIVDRFDEVKR